ncbi:hypothetical protein D3C78_1126640 [compost metagenome]
MGLGDHDLEHHLVALPDRARSDDLIPQLAAFEIAAELRITVAIGGGRLHVLITHKPGDGIACHCRLQCYTEARRLRLLLEEVLCCGGMGDDLRRPVNHRRLTVE